MDVQVEMIQPGWTVFAADGQELGVVVSVEHGTLTIKKRGLLGMKEFHVPSKAVTDVETGRVELSMTKQEVETTSTG